MKNFLCPVCNSSVVETQYFNVVYKDNNYYCESCNSYHVFKKIDDSAYYKENYHEKFNYKLSTFKYKLISLLPFIAYRSTARLVYLKTKLKKIKFKNILEIGAGAGEHFIVFNNYFKLEKYTMVEPGVVIGYKNEKLKVIDSIFEATNVSDYKDIELIMMFHVLEHIYDLDEFFEKIKKTGAKYFYFEVPNVGNEQCKNLSLLDHPHYHHFTIESLYTLFERYNLKPIVIEGIEPISYHPFNKIGFLKKYFLRFFKKNEIYNLQDGMYTRGIVELR